LTGQEKQEKWLQCESFKLEPCRKPNGGLQDRFLFRALGRDSIEQVERQKKYGLGIPVEDRRLPSGGRDDMHLERDGGGRPIDGTWASTWKADCER